MMATPDMQTLGRSKRKRVTTRLNEVNDSHFTDCLCGSVADPASDGVLMCKQVGCETQWVFIFKYGVVLLLTQLSSTIYNVFHLSKPHEIGFAKRVYRLEGHEEGSGHENDVRLLYITIYRNVPD